MKILILGQTPPPYGGQAINIEKMIRVLNQHKFNYRLIRMNFSDDISDMGRFSLNKIGRLLRILFQLSWQLLTYRPNIIYYPPAGPQRTPIFRDMILLFPIRLFRFTTVFHYHAGGLSEAYKKFNPLLRFFYRFAYYNIDYSICLSQHGRKDPEFLRSKKILVIPSGVEDPGYNSSEKNNEKFTVLFAGLCCASKGVLDFIEIIRAGKQSNPFIHGKILGKIASSKEATYIKSAVEEGLISYEGVQTGEAKKEHFKAANAFLFPSFFESENFPTVIIEAFASGLPVIATDWRGIADQVIDGYNGFLHEPHDIKDMAASILELSNNNTLHRQLAANARRDFETKYTMGIFEESIVTAFKSFK
jgi:glycosyltransferase involved in cell wall biosynthesis